MWCPYCTREVSVLDDATWRRLGVEPPPPPACPKCHSQVEELGTGDDDPG